MQSSYPDGSAIFRTGTVSDINQEIQKLAEGRLAGFQEHAPGDIVIMPSGARYEVQVDGSWKRLPEVP